MEAKQDRGAAQRMSVEEIQEECDKIRKRNEELQAENARLVRWKKTAETSHAALARGLEGFCRQHEELRHLRIIGSLSALTDQIEEIRNDLDDIAVSCEEAAEEDDP
jgi:prefoldin subunit 5